MSFQDPLLPYLVLPYEMLDIEDPADIEITEPPSETVCEGLCQITKTLKIKDDTYHNRIICRKHYIEAKLLPYFYDKRIKKHDFGFGPKKIDSLIEVDIPRMTCTFQNRPIPREKTSGKEGLNLALRCMYRIAGYDDELLLKITQVYNQRIGIDHVKLIRNTIYNQDHMPILDSQDAKLNLFRSRDQIYITARISGKIMDFTKDDNQCDASFRACGIYNVKQDKTIHIVEFKPNSQKM